MWSTIFIEGIEIPITVYKHKSFFRYWWMRAVIACGLGETNVIILGRPSVGKTILHSHLNREPKIDYKVPETSTNIETKAIKLSDWTKIVRVLPGQGIHERAIGLDEVFHKNKKLEGVIYIVDWGCSVVKDRVIKEKFLTEDKILTIEALRNQNLKSELEDFNDIMTKIRDSKSLGGGPKWILIIVNKVDLFFDKLDIAEKYYYTDNRSPFNQILIKTINQIGEQNIKFDVLPLCLWEENLEWNGEVLITSLGGNEVKQKMFSKLIDTLFKLTK